MCFVLIIPETRVKCSNKGVLHQTNMAYSSFPLFIIKLFLQPQVNDLDSKWFICGWKTCQSCPLSYIVKDIFFFFGGVGGGRIGVKGYCYCVFHCIFNIFFSKNHVHMLTTGAKLHLGRVAFVVKTSPNYFWTFNFENLHRSQGFLCF